MSIQSGSGAAIVRRLSILCGNDYNENVVVLKLQEILNMRQLMVDADGALRGFRSRTSSTSRPIRRRRNCRKRRSGRPAFHIPRGRERFRCSGTALFPGEWTCIQRLAAPGMPDPHVFVASRATGKIGARSNWRRCAVASASCIIRSRGRCIRPRQAETGSP